MYPAKFCAYSESAKYLSINSCLLVICFFQSFDVVLDVPNSFLQVLNLCILVFQAVTPQIFNGVSNVEVVVPGDLDALDADGVAGVMAWM